MRVLVIGGTGQVGAEVVRAVRERGQDAVPLSRSGQGGIALDMADASALEQAARGFDAALLITQIGPQESRVGLAVHAALAAAGITRIAYVAIMNIEAMSEIPHFAAKRPIREAVLAAGGVSLDCNFFMQNDLLVLPAIVHAGVYPLPVGPTGVEPIDTRDVALAAANLLVGEGWPGGAIPLCGPKLMTGSGYAQSWSEALGKTVHYAGDAIDPFIAAMRGAMNGLDPWLENDFRAMMRVTQQVGCLASDADRAHVSAAVGRPLRTHSAFASEHA